MTKEEKIKHLKKHLGVYYHPNMTYLNASGTGITDVSELKSLEYLNASGTGITDVSELKSLEYLDARGTGITDNEIETLLLSKSIGSRYDLTEYWIESDEIKCGCWKGNLKQFKERVNSVYSGKDNKHRIDYMKFIDECEMKRKK